MNRWLGKTAVVTGAGSGMGKAITCALLRYGVNVVALDNQKERLMKLDEKHKSDNSNKLHSICCDVTIENEIDKAFLEITTLHGGVDIMVNCAGVNSCSRIIGTLCLC